MTALAFQNNLGQVQGLKVSDPFGTPEKTLREHPWILDYEKLNLPTYRIFGDPLTRHHPHGRRVRHINGLLDIPICAVFDYDPPTATNRTAETLDGATDGKVLEEPTAPVKQKGRNSSSSSSNIRRLRDALSDGSAIERKIAKMKQLNGFRPHLSDIQTLPSVSPWREKLRALVASLGLPSIHPDHDIRKEPVRNESHGDRPRTTSSIQALGTVGRAPGRPLTTGSGTEKLPPLKGLYPRLLEGYSRPWFLQRNSSPGTSSFRNHGLYGEKPGKDRTPIVQGHARSTTRPVHYSEATGRLIPPPSRATSRGFSSGASRKREKVHLGGCQKEKTEEEEMEELVLGILCQLLEVDDLKTVRTWLINAPDSEKAIVLDLVRTALTGRPATPASDETRRNNLNSGLKEHSRPFGGVLGDSMEADDASWGAMATGDVGWTNQKAGGNGARKTDRVDRLVFDHSQPHIRTNLITCSAGTKDNGQERSCKRTNEGQKVIRNDHVASAASKEDFRMTHQ